MLLNKRSMLVQMSIAVFLLVICTMFLLLIPKSSSWLHREQNMEGSYKIGKIDIWLNGIEDTVTQINVSANAPTKFLTEVEERDEFFDIAVNIYEINAINMGDIDVKIDLSCTDDNQTNYSVYYIFVPADTEEIDFLEGNYKDYLESVFTGYTLETPAQYKSAMNNINQKVLAENKGKIVLKEEESPIFYILVWSEYDLIENVMSADYVSERFSIIINAYSYQLYITES